MKNVGANTVAYLHKTYMQTIEFSCSMLGSLGFQIKKMRRLVTFKNSRIVYGTLFSIAGIILMLIPIIPGYVFLLMGILLLHRKVPIFGRLLKWLKKKDRKGYLDRVESRLNGIFNTSENASSQEMDSSEE